MAGTMPVNNPVYVQNPNTAPPATFNVDLEKDKQTDYAAHNGDKQYHNAAVVAPEHERTGCCNMTQRTARLVSSLLLLIACLASIACVCGYKHGWAVGALYNISYPIYPRPFNFSVWAGWIKGSDNVRFDFPKLLGGEYLYLKDVEYVAQVAGGFTGAFFIISMLLAPIFIIMNLVGAASGKMRACGRSMWIPSLILAICCFVSSCLLFIALGIGIDRKAKELLKMGLIPHPDWAFYLGIAASFCWLANAIIARKMPRRSKTVAVPAYHSNVAPIHNNTAPVYGNTATGPTYPPTGAAHNTPVAAQV